MDSESQTNQRAKEPLEERATEYKKLDAWASEVDGHMIVRCPDCETPMHLGRGWRGCSIPECPDCNETADTWTFEPTISEARARELAADDRQFSKLVNGQ